MFEHFFHGTPTGSFEGFCVFWGSNGLYFSCISSVFMSGEEISILSRPNRASRTSRITYTMGEFAKVQVGAHFSGTFLGRRGPKIVPKQS